MIAVELVACAIAGGIVGAAITVRRMPSIVAGLSRKQRLAFAKRVNELADE